MRRPQPGEYDPYYEGYIERTRGADALQNLEDSGDMLLDFLENLPEDKRDFAYAEGKWTIRQLLQHLVDCEMVFTFRALWIARSAKGALMGFDENAWADNSLEALPAWEVLIGQFKNLRNYSISLFHSFPEKWLDNTEFVNGHQTRLGSIPYIIAGHTFHHLHILKTRYV